MSLEHVRVDWTGTGFRCDPAAYLDWLDQHAGELPPGAAAFATAPGHYDLYSPRCPKSLRSPRIRADDGNAELTLELFFGMYGIRERDGLRITYADVVDFRVEVTADRGRWTSAEVRRLGDFLLDEVVPHEAGCRHEIRLAGGTVTVIAADLSAEWVELTPG